ncbi:MAG: homoserine dehydrogenase [Desulforegulaceae bacterium]|nr:homoserine dehydrogenase [Desulforegulaceae bacterium]
MKKICLGLLGCGTVGKGVVKLLEQNSSILESKLGCSLFLKKIADLNIQDLEKTVPEGTTLTNDPFEITDDNEIDIVIELIGGTDIAQELITRAIKNKKHIVTANKKLLAINGPQIFEEAVKNNIEIGFEASTGGAMPVIKTMRESLCGNKILETAGILNGTCNYILSKITNENIGFETALYQAQKNGFAEKDPSLDINGDDTAHKLSIISSIAYGTKINFSDIYIEGITNISKEDIENASDFGYRIKLMAISKNHGDSFEARVHPTMIPYDHILAKIDGSLNAISIHGDASGEIVLNGIGAGMMPTASAVLSDICDIARNICCNISSRIPSLSFLPKNLKEIPVVKISEISCKYYMRLTAKDSPGVLSKVSGILGSFGISIKSVHQKGKEAEINGVPIVMITHRAKESDIQKAVSGIGDLDEILEKPVIIRIEDEF